MVFGSEGSSSFRFFLHDPFISFPRTSPYYTFPSIDDGFDDQSLSLVDIIFSFTLYHYYMRDFKHTEGEIIMYLILDIVRVMVYIQIIKSPYETSGRIRGLNF